MHSETTIGRDLGKTQKHDDEAVETFNKGGVNAQLFDVADRSSNHSLHNKH